MGGGACLLVIVGVLYVLGNDMYTHTKVRTMADAIQSHEKVDLRGLRDLQASGGPAIDFQDLQKKLSAVSQPIMIVDGIGDEHGYVKGIPTIFFGYYCKERDQLRYRLRRLIFTGTPSIRPDLVVPEEEMAKRYGFGYTHINIYSQEEGAVDKFVSLVDTLPKNVWFHFHCRGGRGRTSMMLVMFDIMHNAPQVSLADIVKRQHLLGSQNLFDVSPWKRSTYSPETLQRRKHFIEQFYDFICQRKAGGVQRWSDWQRQEAAA